MPARHADAIGYLNELARDVAQPWFTMVCDLAISATSTLDQFALDTLFALFTDRASYLGMKPSSTAMAAPATAPTAAAADFLQTLLGFSNFKRLEGTLEVAFTKRITLVFGSNSSGKSSLCESLKVLASAEEPSRPLHNVRAKGTAVPAFRYKFRSDTAAQAWTLGGLAPRADTNS